MSNEDTSCLIGYNFEPEYSTHELELLEEIVACEDSKIPPKEWCDCVSCEEMNKTEKKVRCKGSDLTIPSIKRFNSESHFNP